jgi:hypothetical protein
MLILLQENLEMMNNTLSTGARLQAFAPIPDRVISADLIGEGLVITFEDGKTAIYSATLLKKALQSAREITGLVLDDESIRVRHDEFQIQGELNGGAHETSGKVRAR